MTLVLPPLLNPREHGRIPQHIGHDAKHDLIPSNVELLQAARLSPDVRLDTILTRDGRETGAIIHRHLL